MPSKVKTDKTPVELLTARQAKAEHARLTVEISEHDRRYYQQDRPTITDAAYDALRARYNAIETRFPDLRTLEVAVAQGWRCAVGQIQESPACGANALAG